MKTQHIVLGALALSAMPFATLRPAAAVTINVSTCASQIATQQKTLQTKILTAIQNCDKSYRKDIVNIAAGKASDYTKAAKACQIQLAKVIPLSSSAMGKTKTTLDGYIGKKCDDVSLSLLGHLPFGKFQDLWSRAVVMTALDKAYQQQITIARDTVAMFQNLGCAPGQPGSEDPTKGCPRSPTPHTSLCPLCDALSTAPCFEHACTYLSAGGSGFSLKSDALPIPIAGDLIGETSFALCKFMDINPSNEYIITGVTSKGIQPVVITGIGHACPLAIGAEGYIDCAGSNHGQVDYQTCEDSKVANLQDSAGGCSAISPDVCAPATVDTTTPVPTGEPLTFNGGSCIAIGTKSTVVGGSFINNTTQLNTPLSGQEGSQGACSDDDLEALALASTIPLTTGTANTQVLETEVGTLANGPDSGAPFPCGAIQTSSLSGAKIAGAFPGVSQPVTNDTATIFHIKCQ